MQRIAVIDYGMGNLRSVSKAIEHVCEDSAEVVVSADRTVIESADRIVFPGQGAVRDCMAEIHRFELAPTLAVVIQDRPFLGICMGLQVLLERSEEHWDTTCLGLVPGTVRGFSTWGREPGSGQYLTVPQMGWNQVHFTRTHALWHGVDSGAFFYFANSFYAAPDDLTVVTGHTRYGIEFASALGRDNFFATQFHPEKSAKHGLQVLKNFVNWDGAP